MGLPLYRLEGEVAEAVAEARAGRVVEITSEGRVVARIVPAREDDVLPASGEPLGVPNAAQRPVGTLSLADWVLEDRR